MTRKKAVCLVKGARTNVSIVSLSGPPISGFLIFTRTIQGLLLRADDWDRAVQEYEEAEARGALTALREVIQLSLQRIYHFDICYFLLEKQVGSGSYTGNDDSKH